MVYKNGENYANACARSERKAVIYLACNSGSNQVNSLFLTTCKFKCLCIMLFFLCFLAFKTRFRILEENNERNDSCAYVFKLMTPLLCGIDLKSEGEGISDGEDGKDTPNTSSSSVIVTTSTGTSASADRSTNATSTNNTLPTPSPSRSSSSLGFFSILLIV